MWARREGKFQIYSGDIIRPDAAGPSTKKSIGFLKLSPVEIGAQRAHEAGKGACNCINGKIETWH